jgi:polysaccharide export outer membrane protein
MSRRITMEKKTKILVIAAILCALPILSLAEGETPISPIKSGATAESETEELKVIATEEPTQAPTQPQEQAALPPAPVEEKALLEQTKYTLGPDDIIEIIVLRHPEFSGTFPVNKEGKIQFKFVGDLEVNGLTKQELEGKIKQAISTYVISPEVNVTITEYRSKIFYVLGEVGAPGKYYMRAEKLPVREAVFLAGLPTYSASMRKCRIISPDESGRAKVRKVDLYSLLYGGDLRKDISLFPGDVLYVPATVMAKVIRIINPIASTIGIASGTPSDVSAGREAAKTLVK